MKTNLQNIQALEKTLANVLSSSHRSAWSKGVQLYAVDMLYMAIDRARYDFENNETPADITKEAYFLNGAANWVQYSLGGCALIYDAEIAERVCTPSELRRKRGGELRPNGWETWLDVQARALSQAWRMILDNMPR